MENGGDIVYGIELPGGDVHHQFVGGVIGEREPSAVEAVEGDERGEREPLIAVDQGVISCY